MVEGQRFYMIKLITLLSPLGLVYTLTMLFLLYLLTDEETEAPVFVREME